MFSGHPLFTRNKVSMPCFLVVPVYEDSGMNTGSPFLTEL